MAVILSDNFTGTNGDAWNASNWTTRTEGTTGSSTIQTNRGRATAATGAYTAQYALGAPASGDADDFDVTFSWADTSTGEQYIDFIYRCTTNPTSGVPGSAFVVEIGPNSDKIGVYSLDSGGAFSTGIFVTSAGVNDTNRHWMRVLVVGTQHKVKWWDDGSGEPGTWQIDETDPDGGGWTTGRVLLGKLNGAAGTSRSTDFDDFSLDDLTVSATATPATLAMTLAPQAPSPSAGGSMTPTPLALALAVQPPVFAGTPSDIVDGW